MALKRMQDKKVLYYQRKSMLMVNGSPFKDVFYDSWQESMKAHAKLLHDGTSWNAKQYQHVLMQMITLRLPKH